MLDDLIGGLTLFGGVIGGFYIMGALMNLIFLIFGL